MVGTWWEKVFYVVVLGCWLGMVVDAVAGDAVHINNQDQITAENWDQAVYKGVKVADMVDAVDRGGLTELIQLAKQNGAKFSELTFFQLAGRAARSERNAARHAANADRYAANADRLAIENAKIRVDRKTIRERTDRKFRQGLEMLKE
ncbi:hypothetical protein ACQZV8_18015 [Magnetococcales bacterium HHB-1]